MITGMIRSISAVVIAAAPAAKDGGEEIELPLRPKSETPVRGENQTPQLSQRAKRQIAELERNTFIPAIVKAVVPWHGQRGNVAKITVEYNLVKGNFPKLKLEVVAIRTEGGGLSVEVASAISRAVNEVTVEAYGLYDELPRGVKAVKMNNYVASFPVAEARLPATSAPLPSVEEVVRLAGGSTPTVDCQRNSIDPKEFKQGVVDRIKATGVYKQYAAANQAGELFISFENQGGKYVPTHVRIDGRSYSRSASLTAAPNIFPDEATALDYYRTNLSNFLLNNFSVDVPSCAENFDLRWGFSLEF